MLDAVIIVVYLLAMIGIGAWVYARRQTTSRDGFFVANRTGSTLFVTGSLAATFIGASVVIGMAGRGYRMGLPATWWLLVGAIGLLFLGIVLARRVRGVGLYTLPELVGHQYGTTASISASVLVLVSWTAIIAAQILAAGNVLAVMIPWDLTPLMGIAAAVFVAYTVLGGQYSVIRTDLAQLAILLIGILVALGLVLWRADGIGNMFSSLPAGHTSFPLNDSFTWTNLVTLLVLTGSTYVVGPDIYSRLFCARDGNVARAASLGAAALAIPIAFVVVLIGMGAVVLFPDLIAQHADLGAVKASELAFPTVINDVLPVGVSGLVVAALLAAIMSSADTLLMTTSTILTEDVIGKSTGGLTEERSLLISRVAIVGLGGVSFLVALYAGGIISSLLLAYTIFTSGIVIPVVAGFYKGALRVNHFGALAGIIGGGGTALALNRLGVGYLEPLNLTGFGVCLVLLFGVSWLANKAGWVRQPD